MSFRVIAAASACLGFAFASSSVLAQAATRTPWQKHDGGSPVQLSKKLDAHGALAAYEHAEIPAEGDRGWGAAPDGETIGFGGPQASNLKSKPCMEWVDYTYFQTFVDVPAGTRVTEFKITFNGMDDGSRISIFNSAHPQGTIVEGSYVRLGGSGTTDLHSLLVQGRNRIVITQVDDCPTGNQLRRADVVLNGQAIRSRSTSAPGPFIPTSHGDVHIRSTDGINWDFQYAGDFVLFQSVDGEVVMQSRQEMWDQNPNVSVNRAGAMRVMSDTVELYLRPTQALYVNGKPTAMPTSRTPLPGGGAIEPKSASGKKMLMLYWPNDSMVGRFVYYANDTMDIEIRRDYGTGRTFEGLIGNMDKNRNNDLQVRGGEYLGATARKEVIARVGESWRVRPDESLFTRDHPGAQGAIVQKQTGIEDIDPQARKAAQQTCKTAGISDALALRNCTYDVAATGDDSFVESARQFQETVAQLPAEERAGEKVEPAHVQVPAAVSPSPGSSGLLSAGETLLRGSRYSMAGHYLTFQQDGNLCLYKAAGDQWVWCINNDPAVEYQRAAAAQMTREGRLVVTDAGGAVIWQVPAGDPQPGTQVHVTDQGALELRAPNGSVLWTSRSR